MTHKYHAMTLVKPWPQMDIWKAHLREIVANLKHIVEIPTGYQDENGFHLGPEPEDIQSR